jgi:hypothetical protein
MLEEAPTFAEVAGSVIDRLRGSIVVAHNISFEDRILADEFRRIGARMPVVPGLCTWRLAKRVLPIKSHRLGRCCSYLKIGIEDAHAALADAYATAQLAPLLMQWEDAPLTWPRPQPALPSVGGRCSPVTRLVAIRTVETPLDRRRPSRRPAAGAKRSSGTQTRAAVKKVDSRTRARPAAGHGRVWCHPGVPAKVVRAIENEGFEIATYLTASVVAVVCVVEDASDAKLARASDLGIPVLTTSDLSILGIEPSGSATGAPEKSAGRSSQRRPSGRSASEPGRVWCHDDVPQSVVRDLERRGFEIASWLDGSVTAAVCRTDDPTDQVLARARESGILVLHTSDLSALGVPRAIQVAPSGRTATAAWSVPRLWCHPSVSPATRVALERAGYRLVADADDPGLMAVVCAPGQAAAQSIARARGRGVLVVLESDLSRLEFAGRKIPDVPSTPAPTQPVPPHHYANLPPPPAPWPRPPAPWPPPPPTSWHGRPPPPVGAPDPDAARRRSITWVLVASILAGCTCFLAPLGFGLACWARRLPPPTRGVSLSPWILFTGWFGGACTVLLLGLSVGPLGPAWVLVVSAFCIPLLLALWRLAGRTDA